MVSNLKSTSVKKSIKLKFELLIKDKIKNYNMQNSDLVHLYAKENAEYHDESINSGSVLARVLEKKMEHREPNVITF